MCTTNNQTKKTANMKKAEQYNADWREEKKLDELMNERLI